MTVDVEAAWVPEVPSAGVCPPLVLRDRRFDAGRPAVMAIVNLTTDSFFSGNRYLGSGQWREDIAAKIAEGADLIDLGGVRAGEDGDFVSADEEWRRVSPALAYLREAHPATLVSLDTWRSEVARRAVEVGVDLINDTWAGADPELVAVAADAGLGIVCSHTGGLPPRTDPKSVTYRPEPFGVVADIVQELRSASERAVAAGVRPESVVLDPTLDFGKTTRHSLMAVRATPVFAELGHPVMQALSRKKFIGETLALPAEERLEGSLAALSVAAWLGAVMFRVHDVRESRRVLDMVAAIRGDREPTAAARGIPPDLRTSGQPGD